MEKFQNSPVSSVALNCQVTMIVMISCSQLGGKGEKVIWETVGFKGTFGKTEIGKDVEKTVIQANTEMRKGRFNLNSIQCLILVKNIFISLAKHGKGIQDDLFAINWHPCVLPDSALPTQPVCNHCCIFLSYFLHCPKI